MTFRKRHPPAGARPGTLVIPPGSPRPSIRLAKFNEEHLEERKITAVSELAGVLDDDTICWIDVQGFGDEAVLSELAQMFSIHRLALADVVNVPSRPSTEYYDEHTLCITRVVLPSDDGMVPDQVSVFIGKNYVLTFQEQSANLFESILERIRRKGAVIRNSGPGYLAYALLDVVVDSYYPVLEQFGEHLQAIEDQIVARPEPGVLHEIHQAKRDLLAIRRAIWPQREVVNALIRDENPFLSEDVRLYLRNSYEHCVQIMDGVETYRELAGGLMDVYLSSVGNRQNEVMKVLTVMASIFIPLTFLAGVYGMNFEEMPELRVSWAYPALLATMLVIAFAMVVYFRHKGWLGRAHRRKTRS